MSGRECSHAGDLLRCIRWVEEGYMIQGDRILNTGRGDTWGRPHILWFWAGAAAGPIDTFMGRCPCLQVQ